MPQRAANQAGTDGATYLMAFAGLMNGRVVDC